MSLSDVNENTKVTLTVSQLRKLLRETLEDIDITGRLVKLLEHIRDLTSKTDDKWHSIGGRVASEINVECHAALKLIERPNIKNPGFKMIDTFKRIQAMTDKTVFETWMPLPSEIVQEINEICENTLSTI